MPRLSTTQTAAALLLIIGGWAMLLVRVPSSASAQESNQAERSTEAPRPVIIDDFESEAPGTFPDGWVYVTRDREIESYEEARDSGETVMVKEEDGNRFVRVVTRDAVARYTKRNGTDFDWTLGARPILKWRWRAVELPAGASEKEENDVGAAVYVTFGTDWLGRPKSIKYTYSSSLSVGTTVDFGSLHVIVVDSRPESEIGTWETVTRDVADDYKQVFGEEPPSRPSGITFWGDSDTTHNTSRADFDDLRLLPRFHDEG